MWNLYPDCLVAIVGGYEECYSREFLVKYKHNHIFIKNDEPVYSEIQKLSTWKLVHKDKYARLFSKY